MPEALAGVALGTHASVLRDAGGKLALSQVQRGPTAERFEAIDQDLPTFGFSTDAFWFRFRVQNPAATPYRWLLELAYPHHDRVDLYVPSGPGGAYEQRRVGDLYPFHTRAVDHPNFLFELTEPAASERTYYLRIQTAGSVEVPLRAWTYREFVAHQLRDEAGNWLFYGVILIMAAYNGTVFLFVKHKTYLLYMLYNLSILLFSFSIKGHTFALLLPDHPRLANQVIPFAVAQTFTWTTGFLRAYLDFKTSFPRADAFWRGAFWTNLLLSGLTIILPYSVSIRLVAVVGGVLTLIAPFFVVVLIRRGVRAARIYLLGWSMLIIGAALYFMKTAGVLPGSFIGNWGVQLGAAAEVLVLSLALADRINAMRTDMALLNDQLSRNVKDLKSALAEARAATKAKSEFVATMSHELRTPLNAIINLPQGLLEDFRAVETAGCLSCDSVFQLDPGDRVEEHTPCPECGQTTLQRQRVMDYQGSPLETARHLASIERSGRHLLDMVNNILDFSKLEADRMELNVRDTPILNVLEEAVEPLEPLAKKSGVSLALSKTDDDLWVAGDPLRLKQVLINLIGNAIKFSDGRGTVTVGAERDRRACVVFVRDQGVGIAPEDQERIFRSFEQVHKGDTRKYGGTGLGLSISASLIARHQGHIWVESTPGEGSTFYFSVPLADASNFPRREQSQIISKSSRPPTRIELNGETTP